MIEIALICLVAIMFRGVHQSNGWKFDLAAKRLGAVLDSNDRDLSLLSNALKEFEGGPLSLFLGASLRRSVLAGELTREAGDAIRWELISAHYCLYERATMLNVLVARSSVVFAVLVVGRTLLSFADEVVSRLHYLESLGIIFAASVCLLVWRTIAGRVLSTWYLKPEFRSWINEALNPLGHSSLPVSQLKAQVEAERSKDRALFLEVEGLLPLAEIGVFSLLLIAVFWVPVTDLIGI